MSEATKRAPDWWRRIIEVENAREEALVAEIARLRRLLEDHGIPSDPPQEKDDE